jgi:hypothetical protein
MKKVITLFLFLAVITGCEKKVKTPVANERKGVDSVKAGYDNRQYPWQVTTYGNFNEAYKRYNNQGC